MGIILILFILSTAAISNALVIKQPQIKNANSDTINRQIYIGYASIIGNGSSSILEAVAENDLLIGISYNTALVDFYIDYDMNCSGATDEGIVTLTISRFDQDISSNLVQTPTIKNGQLKIENIEIHRGDALGFAIVVAYGSIIPPYTNSTSAIGAGVVPKAKSFVCLYGQFFEQHPRLLLLLRQLLDV